MSQSSSLSLSVLAISLLLQSGCTSNQSVSDKAASTHQTSQPAQLEESVMQDTAVSAAPVTRAFAAKDRPMMAEQHYGIFPSDYPVVEESREQYASYSDNPVRRAAEFPVSTFSIDVDTGSYSNIRRFLNQGSLPNEDAVRVEEMINYFSYQYPQPKNNTQPFSISTEVGPTPWNSDTQLLHIGIQGVDVAATQLPEANLVFLIDISGSMQAKNKLPLLKSALKMLAKQMDETDKISLVVYAGETGIALKPTQGKDRRKILRAINKLSASGSTNGAAGIELAYDMAEEGFIEGGINRVILATDGDFNVGLASVEALKKLIREKRTSGVSLTTLGFGSGNYNDHLMEQLADEGNGNYAYIDTLNEARKVLVDERASTLHTIARDVKIQIEFNPEVVAEYRLLGYENRQLKREDFNNDKVDAGDIGAGHTVTALYEVTLKNSHGQRIEPLRYQPTETQTKPAKHHQELALLRLRYKPAETEKSELIEQTIDKNSIVKDIDKTSENYRFSASVAAFGQTLRQGKYLQSFSMDDVLSLAQSARGKDESGYRAEFIQLLKLAQTLQPLQAEKQQVSQLRNAL
ncbi:MAG: VWA domain-containing protein [Gammaproteobacteria bacterium]